MQEMKEQWKSLSGGRKEGKEYSLANERKKEEAESWHWVGDSWWRKGNYHLTFKRLSLFVFTFSSPVVCTCGCRCMLLVVKVVAVLVVGWERDLHISWRVTGESWFRWLHFSWIKGEERREGARLKWSNADTNGRTHHFTSYSPFGLSLSFSIILFLSSFSFFIPLPRSLSISHLDGNRKMLMKARVSHLHHCPVSMHVSPWIWLSQILC